MDEFALIDPRAWTEVLRATLSNTLGHALFISTPTGKSNWAYDLFVRHQEDPEHWSSHQYTSLEGGNIPPDEIAQAMRDLDARTFRQEYEASFEDFIGRIAWAFDRELNLHHIEEPDTRILHVGGDFNVNPITCAIHIREGDDLYQIDEIAMYSSNTQELCDELKNRYPTSKIFFYPDPAGHQKKTSAGGNTDISILSNNGFIVKAPRRHNLVKDRINSYNSRLCSADGQRHLFIDPKCKKTIESLEKFTYKEGTQVPDKNGFDHMFDAASYCIDFLFPLTRDREEDLDMPRMWGHAIR
jgi:phage terminase large subunit